MKEENQEPLPGEEGHWRYNKDKNFKKEPSTKGKEKGQTTSESMKDLNKKVVDKYTKTDLMDKTKEDQIEILENFGLNDKEIKILNNEDKRIKKILQLQK